MRMMCDTDHILFMHRQNLFKFCCARVETVKTIIIGHSVYPFAARTDRTADKITRFQFAVRITFNDLIFQTICQSLSFSFILSIFTCPDIFIILNVLLRLQTKKFSGVLGNNWIELTVRSTVPEPTIAVDLNVCKHSVVFKLHIY